MRLLADLLACAAYASLLGQETQAGATGSPGACPRKSPLLNPGTRFCAPVLDDKTATKSWDPWAYRPHCVGRGRDKKSQLEPLDELEDLTDAGDGQEEETEEKEETEKYCLYTSTFFGDHGISVLARPEAAAEAAETVWGVYHSSFPDHNTVQYLNLEGACELVDMPHKGGKGVVAKRRIRRKDTFLVDHAVITGDLDLWGFAAHDEGHDILERAAEQLVHPDAARTLSHGAGGDGVEAVMRSNTFRTYLNGVAQKALFPKISVRRTPESPGEPWLTNDRRGSTTRVNQSKRRATLAGGPD